MKTGTASLRSASFLLVVLILCRRQVPVASWGKEGHEIVGNLAWKLISNQTKNVVATILGTGLESSNYTDCLGCSPLALVADWADMVKHTKEFSWSPPLHYIDVQDKMIEGGCPVWNATFDDGNHGNGSGTSCFVVYERDCKNDFCVAGAVVNYTRHLENRRSAVVDAQRNLIDQGAGRVTPEDKKLVRNSLKFLTHFVGDIHQPLHASRASDFGGNSISVHFDVRGPSLVTRNRERGLRSLLSHGINLHSVWDSGIIDRCLFDDFKNSRQALEGELFQLIIETRRNSAKSNKWKRWVACPDGGSGRCTSQWAQESFARALKWAYRNVDGREINKGDNITTEYYETRLPIVKEQLAVAGVRLASTLEICLA